MKFNLATYDGTVKRNSFGPVTFLYYAFFFDAFDASKAAAPCSCVSTIDNSVTRGTLPDMDPGTEQHVIRIRAVPTTRTDLICVRCGCFRTQFAIVPVPGSEEHVGVHKGCLLEYGSRRGAHTVASLNMTPTEPVREPEPEPLTTADDPLKTKPRRRQKPKVPPLDLRSDLEKEEDELRGLVGSD